MDKGDSHNTISFEDMAGYIQMKSIDDYTYRDAIMVLNSSVYEKVSYEFITFMGRMLETTIIRVYPRKDVGEDLFKHPTYTIPYKSNYPIRVRYKEDNGVRLVQYATDYVVTDFDTSVLEMYIHEYMKRNIEIAYRGQPNQYMNDINQSMFYTIRWIETYIGDKLGVTWEDGINKRIEDYVTKLKEYAEINKLRYPEELEVEVRGTFTEIKDSQMAGNLQKRRERG